MFKILKDLFPDNILLTSSSNFLALRACKVSKGSGVSPKRPSFKELLFSLDSFKLVDKASLFLISNSYNEGKYTDNLIKYLINPLNEVGIEVLGITLNKETREEEITTYLIEHPEINSFYILDDEYEFSKYKDNFIKLDYLGNGLEDKHVSKAIYILKKTFD